MLVGRRNLVSDDDVPLSEVTSGPFDISTDLNAAWATPRARA
jgi:hypothetical protein